MEKKYAMILVILLGIGLITQVALNVIWFDVEHEAVEKDFNAKITQCNNIMTFYNDVGTDIINYERATTDTISVTNADEYEQCIKLLASPEWYKKYNYKHFWTNYICVNFFGLVTILVLSVVFASGIDDLTDNSSEGLW